MDSSLVDERSKKMRFEEGGERKKIKGTVVLMKKKILDLNDIKASVMDRFDEILGHKVSLQLISAVNADPNGMFIFFSLENDSSHT